MLWIVPAWVVSVIAFFFLGFYLSYLRGEVSKLREALSAKLDKPEPSPEPQSTFIDPDDVVAEAIRQREIEMRRLNNE